MDMKPDEIVMRYRQAKVKGEQIKILADLNDCTVGDIVDVLVEHGGYERQRMCRAIGKANAESAKPKAEPVVTETAPSQEEEPTEYVIPAKSVPEMLVDSAFDVIRAELSEINRQQYALDMRKAELYKKLWDTLGEVQ